MINSWKNSKLFLTDMFQVLFLLLGWFLTDPLLQKSAGMSRGYQNYAKVLNYAKAFQGKDLKIL